MFKLKSIVVLVLTFFLGISSATASECHSYCSNHNGSIYALPPNGGDLSLGEEEDAWPWVVVDLWKNIEGIWVWEGYRRTEFYRFEIKQRYSDGVLAIKIDVLESMESDKVMASHMSLGEARSLELRTVISGTGFDHFLKVKAYDRSRLQCRNVCSRKKKQIKYKTENIVLGMVLTPTNGNPKRKAFRLLRKYRDL